jgi:hypothetical protein
MPPKGLKMTSSPIQISAAVTESAANTLTSEQIDLSLNALDQEVFVVTQVNMDVDAPDSVVGVTTAANATLSTTQRTSVGSIADQNVLGAAERIIVCNGGMTPDGGIPFDREDPTFTALTEDYIGIIATSDCFLNVLGTNNGNPKQVRCRIYGYRAEASASVYAALVQSEVLSA